MFKKLFKKNIKGEEIKSLEFKGTIIIGDPCEMVKSEDDWDKTMYGEKMDMIGFKNYISFEFEEDSPKVINCDTRKSIGSYCTDSCMICIVYLGELLNYNPDFDQHIEYPKNWTVIEDFDGLISIQKNKDYLSIVGKGNVNFYTK